MVSLEFRVDGTLRFSVTDDPVARVGVADGRQRPARLHLHRARRVRQRDGQDVRRHRAQPGPHRRVPDAGRRRAVSGTVTFPVETLADGVKLTRCCQWNGDRRCRSWASVALPPAAASTPPARGTRPRCRTARTRSGDVYWLDYGAPKGTGSIQVDGRQPEHDRGARPGSPPRSTRPACGSTGTRSRARASTASTGGPRPASRRAAGHLLTETTSLTVTELRVTPGDVLLQGARRRWGRRGGRAGDARVRRTPRTRRRRPSRWPRPAMGSRSRTMSGRSAGTVNDERGGDVRLEVKVDATRDLRGRLARSAPSSSTGTRGRSRTARTR